MMGCVGLAGGASSVWFSSRAMLRGQGLSLISWPKGHQNLPKIFHPGSHLGEIDLVHFVLVVMPMRMTHWDLPPQGLAVLSAMAADGLQHDGWAAKTFLTHEAQLVVHCLQVVDNGDFVLTLLPTPGAVGQPVEVAECIQIMYTCQPITFGDSDGDTALKNFRPFGKILIA